MKISSISLSKIIPAVSQIYSITIVRYLWFIPLFKLQKRIDLKREIPPVEIGVARAVVETIILPARLITTIAEEVKEEAEEEKQKAEKTVSSKQKM